MSEQMTLDPILRDAVEKNAEFARLTRHIELEGECWTWVGARNGHGYGRVWSRESRSNAHAHRLAYQMLVGPIPAGMYMDHLCRNRACVNPGHLEPVTNRENILRGEGPTAVNAAKTHCVNGHPFDAQNTRLRQGNRSGTRDCIACRQAWHAERSPGPVPLGSKCRWAKLTESDIPQIFELHRDGLSWAEIASRFGVASATVGDVLLRRTWKHVEVAL